MASIDVSTGALLDDLAEIRQSITTILLTPIGTRVKRRNFGSLIFDLVDSPATPKGALRLIAASADAIERWEPRVRFVSAKLTPNADGRAVLSTVCQLRADGRPLEIPVVFGGGA
jgi:phage baseplate assembly protein W